MLTSTKLRLVSNRQMKGQKNGWMYRKARCDIVPYQVPTNLFGQVYKPVYAALALGLHSCMLLCPEKTIQNCSGKQAQLFLELKNGSLYYHKFSEMHWKITVKEFNSSQLLASNCPRNKLKIIVNALNQVRCTCMCTNSFASSKEQKLLTKTKALKIIINLIKIVFYRHSGQKIEINNKTKHFIKHLLLAYKTLYGFQKVGVFNKFVGIHLCCVNNFWHPASTSKKL